MAGRVRSRTPSEGERVRLRGAAPPTLPSRSEHAHGRVVDARDTSQGGSGPPTPPSDFLSVGALPPRPRPARQAERGHRGHPAPSPLGREGGGEGHAILPRGTERSRAAAQLPAGGCAPPHPHPGASTRCARLRPTHPPSDFLSVGASPPRPRSDRPPASRLRPPLSPRVRALRGRARVFCGGLAPTPPPDRETGARPRGSGAGARSEARAGGAWGGAAPQETRAAGEGQGEGTADSTALSCSRRPRRTPHRLAGYDARVSDDFCAHGCYWECDHWRRSYAGRPIAAIDSCATRSSTSSASSTRRASASAPASGRNRTDGTRRHR